MINHQFTYAELPLVSPSQELLDWIGKNYEFAPDDYFRTQTQGYLDNLDIYFKNYSENFLSKTKLNTLYWPVNASRFAIAFLITTSESLERLPGYDSFGQNNPDDLKGGIRSSVYGKYPNDSVYGYKPHKLTASNTSAPFSAKMWMLPPKPITQLPCFPVNSTQQNMGRFPFPHLESLWLLPLVDDRYWWWWHNTGEFKLGACSSWQELFYTIFTNMGYNLDQVIVDDIDLEYLFPNELFRKQSFNIRVPLLLDMLAHSCNMRIFTNYDGTVRVMSAKNSFAESKKTINTPSSTNSGGAMVFDNFNKSKIGDNFPSQSDIYAAKSSLSTKELAQMVRDTPGVVPEIVSFVINNNIVRIDLLDRDDLDDPTAHPLTNQGDDTLNSQIIETKGETGYYEGKMRYFRDTTETLDGPVNKNAHDRRVSSTEKKSVPYKDGDYILDIKNNITYGPRIGSNWGEATRGKSVLSKYFKIKASSYKESKKDCPVWRVPATGITDKAFNTEQIESFCNVYAKDWALYQIAPNDVSLNGWVPVNLHGLIDHVTFSMDTTSSQTKIVRPPYNDLIEELYIESYLGDEAACDADTYECGQCKGMQGDADTGQLFGFGTSDMFLPYSAIKAKGQSVPANATPATYPWWHKPPYVVKFCLGGAIGTVALDYYFQTAMNVSVYWNGAKVASRLVYGSKSYTCQSGSQSWGRMTFYKTEKTPSYAIVVVDADQSTFGLQQAERPQAMNWYLNMRCVDSIPYPAPRALACDQKLDEIGGVFTLAILTSIPLSIQGSSTGVVPQTDICVLDKVQSSFTCSNGTCVIPAKLSLSFVNPPPSCKFLKDVTIPLQQGSSEGGWIGIYDLFGPTKDIIQARLSMVGTSSFKLVLKDIVNTSKQPVEFNNIPTCLCNPFKIVITNADLSAFLCTPANPNDLQILIKEA